MQTENFLKDLSPQQRKEHLQTNAVDIDQSKKYQKPLTPDELDVKRELLTDNSIKLSEWDDELSIIKDTYKGKMKPLQKENKQLLWEIKTRQTTVDGALYHLPNFDSGFMETYNEDGELIATRKLRPDEKQQTLYSITKIAQ